MEKHVLLDQLQILLKEEPDWENFHPSFGRYQEWLGRAYALLKRWNPVDTSMHFNTAKGFLANSLMKDVGLNTILGLIHQAVQDLKIDLESSPNKVFGPGAVYDFFKGYTDLIETSKSSILIVDPYLDSEIFDAYLGRIKVGVSIRLLASKTKYENDLRVAFQKYEAQFKRGVEVRLTKSIHDRVTIVDEKTCWVLGQSIKDATKKSLTYLVPISQDYSDLKITEYRNIWNGAIPL